MDTNKLCLGTVQFGLNYGINNRTGKPAKQLSFLMMEEALSSGVSFIDTAAAYGDAEVLLGEWGIGQKKIKVISKLRPNYIAQQCANPAKAIEEEVCQSLARMRIEKLDGYLLHNSDEFYYPHILEGLISCKKKGLTSSIGVSIYEPETALDVVQNAAIDYIQVPYSMFDQRLDNTDFFRLAKKNNITVFARSIFLQGLILLKEHEVPETLAEAKQFLQMADEIVADYGFTRKQAAFMFAYSHPDIDYLVIGFDGLEQLREVVDMSKATLNFSVARAELAAKFSNIPSRIVSPHKWAQSKTRKESYNDSR